MDKKRKTKNNLKLSTPKKKSHPSDPLSICHKNVVIQLERLSDYFIAEMTASGSALQPEQIMVLNDEALNINSFPDEMLINIFSNLSHNELGKIARVCRKWNVLTKEPVLWKEVNVKFHASHKSQHAVAKCFVKMLPPCVVRIRLYFVDHYSWKDPLNFKELSMEFQTKCPALKTLILNGAEFSESLHSIIDSCTQFLQNVKILVLDSCGFPRFPTKKGGENAGTSKIEVLDLSWSWLRPFDLPSFLKLPHLKYFHCCSMNLEVYLENEISLYNSFFNQLQVLDLGDAVIGSMTFQAIWNHGLNLEELYMCDACLDDDDFNFNKPVFPRLKTICLRETPTLTCNAVISLIQSCQSLQNVYVTQDLAVSCAAHPFFVANKCKLEIIKIIPDCDEHRRLTY